MTTARVAILSAVVAAAGCRCRGGGDKANPIRSDDAAVDAHGDGWSAPVSAPRTIAVGDNFGCVIRDGEVWCWGDDAECQLGIPRADEASDPHPTAVRVNVGGKAVRIVAARKHACATLENDSIVCWGTPSAPAGSTPIATTQCAPSRIAARGVVALGSHHGCVLQDGHVRCWGSPVKAARGSCTDVEPTVLGEFCGAPTNIVELIVNEERTCFVDAASKLTCAGKERWPVGFPVRSYLTYPDGGRAPDDSAESYVGPTVLSVAGVQRVSIAAHHACALLPRPACWGDNGAGALGNGTRLTTTTPTAIALSATVEQVETAAANTCARTRERAMYCWGANPTGNLGTGASEPASLTPVAVKLAAPVDEFAMSETVVCARDATRVWCWGWNLGGVAGPGKENGVVAIPQEIGFAK